MMQLLCSSILASCGFFALGVGVWLFRHARRLLRDVSSRSLTQLNAEIAELTFSFESLQAQHKRLAQRVGMREARQKGQDLAEADSSLLGDKPIPRDQLKAVARAKGFKVS